MKISLAEVTDRFDPNRNHAFWAKITGEGEEPKMIQGTTPYLGEFLGGFVGNIPGEGTQVLVVQPGDGGEWYYLGATFGQEQQATDTGVNKASADVPPGQRVTDVYGESGAGTGYPNTLAYQDEAGNGIRLIGQRRSDALNVKAEIYSSEGKSISLNDSPGLDCIRINAAHDDSGESVITLTDSDPQNQSMAAHMIQMESTGPQNLINYESETNILVKDGRELQLLNNSTGFNRNPNSSDGSPSQEYGNVNIQSKNKDVNVFSMKEDGRIFIECLREDGFNQIIEIETHGTQGAIRLRTNGDIDIQGGKIGINAINAGGIHKGTIDIKAAGDINIQSGGKISLNATKDIAADGKEIHLNSGASNPANPDIGDATNTYGNLGITTY